MIEQTPRDPWRAVWRVATGEHLMAALLLSVAAGLAIATWLPQMPVADPVAYARWLSEAQARFGDVTPTLQTLGLFTITRSFGFRILLALLAGCLLLRLIESIDRLRRRLQADRWPWAELFPLLAHGGALLFLMGLLITHVWGWRVEGLIVQRGERVTLDGTADWVALDTDDLTVTHSPGIATFVEGRGPGVRAAAHRAGQPLGLQQTADADPVDQLTVPLPEDQYLAIPDAQLIVGLAPQPDRAIDAHTPVLVQVYRSPSGQPITETVMQEDTELTVDSVTLELTSVPYARLTAAFNPGLWPTAAGLVPLGAGVLGGAVWPVRRTWLQARAERIEGAGGGPPAPTGSREA